MWLTSTFILCVLAVGAWGANIPQKDDPTQYEDPNFTVTMAQLYEGVLLPSNDILIMAEKKNNATCGPVPDGYVGIRLERSVTIAAWKAIALHRKDDYTTYKFILELVGEMRPSTSVILRQELLVNYDVCLWKDTGGFLGIFRPENMYHIIDAPELMQSGALYTIVWYRDEYSPRQQEQEVVGEMEFVKFEESV